MNLNSFPCSRMLSAPQIAGLLPAPRKPTLKEMTAGMDAFLGGSFFGNLVPLFDMAGETEELIEDYIRRYPHKADLLWDMFMTLNPEGPLAYDDRARQAHNQELLQRVVEGYDLTRPTTAEIAAYSIGVLLHECKIDEPPPLHEIMGRLNYQPPYVIRELLDHIGTVPRRLPNPTRWYDSVTEERKRAIFGGDIPPQAQAAHDKKRTA